MGWIALIGDLVAVLDTVVDLDVESFTLGETVFLDVARARVGEGNGGSSAFGLFVK